MNHRRECYDYLCHHDSEHQMNGSENGRLLSQAVKKGLSNPCQRKFGMAKERRSLFVDENAGDESKRQTGCLQPVRHAQAVRRRRRCCCCCCRFCHACASICCETGAWLVFSVGVGALERCVSPVVEAKT